MKKASLLLVMLVMAGVAAGWWLATHRPAGPESAASPPPAPSATPAPAVAKPQVRLIRAAARKVTEIDVRQSGRDGTTLLPDRLQALAALRAAIPGTTVEFDPITGAPSQIQATGRFLTPRHTGLSTRDVVGGFIDEHAALFGHRSAALKSARITRDDVTQHSGMSTLVWNQEVDGIPVFKTILKANLTRNGELVTINDHFVAEPAPNRAAPAITAQKAISQAAASMENTVAEGSIMAQGRAQGAEHLQQFSAPGISDATAQLTYLPMNERDLRLGWDVTLFSVGSNEMFRTVVDAESGTVLYRTTLTSDISNATYRVYGDATSKKPFDSPLPMAPGHATPQTTEPAEVPRQLVTLSALDTTASPNGWINDGGQETLGNNVDAHTDTDANNVADLPRPNGGTTRTFDATASLSLAPSTFKDAATINLFYVCNWMHDRLYQLGFTESAGNFQTDNFGRGGKGNDAIQADAQDGSGTNNSNFSTPADGSPGRMQMYLWTAPDPDRDSALDTHIILHEYTHGLSNRLVGGGVGITAWQTMGMGEGWSDFYALCLTTDPSLDPNAVYPMGPYTARLLSDAVTSNYYFGIRRYPYCTDMAKSPLTFKDIDYRQAGTHLGVPLSPRYGSSNSVANQVHAIGEVWCNMLWEVRSALMAKRGRAAGSERVLQLVTDALKLSPANPNFIQARDAILQADLVLSGGADAAEITAAFAKRGLGMDATAPNSLYTDGVVESFDLPDALKVTPLASFSIEATRTTGPIFPASQTFTLKNTSAAAITWSATHSPAWFSLSPSSGTLAPGASVSVVGTVAANVISMPVGTYEDTVTFTNTTTGVLRNRTATLKVNPVLARAAFFSLDTDPMWTREGEWAFGVPTGTHPEYGGGEPASGFTGSNVFGIVLTGACSATPGGYAYLTSGPISTTGMHNVNLRFRRWMNEQWQPAMYATVDVSTDGVSWTNVWQNNNNDNIIENGWSRQTYALGALADNQPAIYVRWGHKVATSAAVPMGSWNIDDVEFMSETTTPGLTATSQNLTTAVNTPVAFTLGGMNTGNPAAPQMVNVLSLPAHGTLTGTTPNLIYTPNPGFSGVETIPFTVTSEGTTSTPACVVITVLPGPPDASVEFPDGTELADGSSVANFGSLAVGLSSDRQFLIRNVSGGPLNLFSTRVDGAHAFEFTLGSPAKSLLAPGESTYLPVTWAPRFVGTKRAVLHILTNDPDEDSYDITITGTGTAFDGGVRLTKDISTGSASIGSLRNVRGNLLFVATSSTGATTLWTSQGTPETTLSAEDVMSPGTNPSAPVQLTVVGSRASFYTGSGNGSTIGLWNSDGTLGGSYKYLSDTTPFFFDVSNRPTQFTALGETLFFSAGISTAQGSELWKSTGTSTGTVLVKEINPTTNAGSAPANMKAFNELLWFTATDGTNGVELWKSDGTTSGTVMVKDIESGASSSSPLLLTGAGSGTTLFFTATTAANGRELYKTDGTSTGTAMVKDLVPGTASSTPTGLVPFADGVLFGATNGTSGVELWKSDGTANGTQLVKDLWTSGSSNATPRLVVNGIAYLTATDGTNGTELWKTDGTANGTVMVKDIYTGSSSSSPANFVQVGNLAYFTATTAAHGTELWKTDGTDAGTVLVSDLNPGTTSSSPTNLTLVGSRLYFTATVAGIGTELFVLDVGPAAEIAVEMVPGTELAPTGATMSFAPQAIVNGRATRTLQIRNLGTQPLVISDTTISGADAAAFTLSSSLAGTQLAAGRSVVLGITFNPATAGAKSASLQIISNDLDEPQFDIALTGTGVTAPEIVVERSNGAGLLDDVSSVMIGDAPQGLQVTDSFTVRNIGSSTLTLGAISIDGTNASSFSATSPGTATLPPGASTSFTVTFAPAAQGAHRAALHLASSDADEASFDFFLTGIGSFAPGPLKLQRDIHRQGAGLAISTGVVLGGTYYFAGNTAASGTELWKTDGTATGTVMVKDIWPGTGSSTPTNFTPMNGLLYFTANDGTNGTELWKTDGTASGTVMVKDITSGSSFPSYLTVMNGALYFAATEISTGNELWKSDGTTAGTVLLKEFITGTGAGIPSQMTVMNNTLYFSATDTANGAELWKSDGTTAGTVLVKDINATAAGTGSGIANLRTVGSQLLFTAKDGINGNELWRSDGTTAGTSLVADISPGATDSAFFYFTASGSYAYFMTSPDGIGSFTGPGQEIWRSDGTLVGTYMLADVRPGYNSSTISSITPDGSGGVYFSANNGVNGFELWKSDGTSPGTQMVKDIWPGASSSSPGSLSLLNGILYFSATTAAGAELWRSDGSDPGTCMLREMNAGDAGGSPSSIIALGSQLIFNASNGGDGLELWAVATDGTSPRPLRDATPGSANSNPSQLNVINDRLCFTAIEDYTGTEWWVDDGKGPRLLKDIKPGTGSGVNGICRLVETTQENGALTRTLFFVGDDGVVGGELWRTDGTTAGTYLVKDILPGSSSSTPTNLVNVSGRLFFAAASTTGGNELWTSDGTEAGTQQVANINLTSNGSGGSFPSSLTGVGATVFFAANDGINGNELWKSDGGPTGTVMVKDLTPGSGSTTFGAFATARGLLFFVADNGTAGSELWVSDGTSAGTFMLQDINATTTNSGGSSITAMAAYNNVLFFNAYNPTYGNELWRSDGTSAGTYLLKDITAGSANSVPSNFKLSGGILYFTALTTANGLELWKTDGTAIGTVMVKDIFPGTSSSVPSGLADINGTLYLSAAASSTEGAELWKSDGTTAGTQLVVDVRPGSGLSSSPANITLMGTRLFFSATGTDTGVELFSYNLNPAPKLVITPLVGSALVDDVSTLDFGFVAPAQSASLIFKLENQGDLPLTLSAPTFTGPQGTEFTLSSLPTTLNASLSTGISLTFTPTASGLRTGALHISSNDPAATSFDVALTGRGLTNYEVASQDAGLPPASENSDPNEDYDGDGLSNMLELAFGTSATTPGGGSLSLSGGSITTNGQPIMLKDAGGMRAVYLRRKDAASLGITYNLQFSANLGLWESSSGAGAATIIAQDATHEAVSVPFPATIAGQPARFFRVHLDLTP